MLLFFRYSLVLLAFCFYSTSLMANESVYHRSYQVTDEYSGFYVGGGMGSAHLWDGIFTSNADTFTGQVTGLDASGVSLHLYSGVYINRIVGVEFSYINHGHFDAIEEGIAGRLSLSSISAAANIGYSFQSGWRAFGIAGLSAVDLQQPNWFDKDRRIALRYGAGAEYKPLSDSGITFRLAYEADLFRNRTAEVNLPDGEKSSQYLSQLGHLYLGASYRF